jgi:hypothetical protein
MMKLCFVFISLCLSLYAVPKGILEKVLPGLQAPIVSHINQDLQTELLDMAREDQRVRDLCFSEKNWSQIIEVDQQHNPRLKEIVAEYGWPGITLVGLEGSQAMWLLVQHQDLDLDFQKECLLRLKNAVDKQEAQLRNYAYLLDRVCMNENKPQVYGTQWVEREGKMGLYSVCDPDYLDQRRWEAGLCSIQDYKEELKKVYAVDLDFE